MTGDSVIWPVRLARSTDRRSLAIDFDNGTTYSIPAELLRVESPSAEVQGHVPSQKVLVRGKHQVEIAAIEAVGNYAVRIVFDDGHDTGIYTWDYLLDLGQNQDDILLTYRQKCQA